MFGCVIVFEEFRDVVFEVVLVFERQASKYFFLDPSMEFGIEEAGMLHDGHLVAVFDLGDILCSFWARVGFVFGVGSEEDVQDLELVHGDLIGKGEGVLATELPEVVDEEEEDLK